MLILVFGCSQMACPEGLNTSFITYCFSEPVLQVEHSESNWPKTGSRKTTRSLTTIKIYKYSKESDYNN